LKKKIIAAWTQFDEWLQENPSHQTSSANPGEDQQELQVYLIQVAVALFSFAKKKLCFLVKGNNAVAACKRPKRA
jgi:hypothetical protein